MELYFYVMSNSRKTDKIIDDFKDQLRIVLKKEKLKMKKKNVIEKTKLLEEVCKKHDLDFSKEFDELIGSKHKVKSSESDVEKNEVSNVDSEKILSKVIIDNQSYWKDEKDEKIYNSKFKHIGSIKNGNLVISNS